MDRRDRAELVVDWLESEGEAGRPVTRETVELAVRRNSMSEGEFAALRDEVARALRRRGYDVAQPAADKLGGWALVGAACLLFWVGLVLLALWYLSGPAGML